MIIEKKLKREKYNKKKVNKREDFILYLFIFTFIIHSKKKLFVSTKKLNNYKILFNIDWRKIGSHNYKKPE